MADVLVVDDSKFMRKIVSDVLTEQGHRIVAEAENGKEAVELCERLKPDLVTLDIVMPEVEGVDALSALRTMSKTSPGTKVVVISTMAQDEIKAEYVRAGAKDFIAKPFHPTHVAKVISQALSES